MRTSSLVIMLIAIPFGIAAVSVAVQLIALPELPHTAAVHWGESGVDGYAPRWVLPLLTAGIYVLLALVPVFLVVSTHRASGQPPTNIRFVAATVWATTAFFSVALAGTVLIQRGLSDASQVEGLGPWMLAGFGAALLFGVVGATATPSQTGAGSVGEDSGRKLRVEEAETVVWSSTERMSAGALALLWVVIGVAAVVICTLGFLNPGAWWLWAIAVPSLIIGVLVVLALSRIRVSITASGLRLRSGLGISLVHVPLDRIVGVEVLNSSPNVGRGVRSLPDGTRAFVLNEGPAVRVGVRGSADLLVSVRDSSRAAAALRS